MSVVTLHIGNLDRSAVPVRNKEKATVATTSNLWLAQRFMGSGRTARRALTCTTNSNGAGSVTKTVLTSGVPSVTFTVIKVVRTGATYQSTANHESNGTTIKVVLR